MDLGDIYDEEANSVLEELNIAKKKKKNIKHEEIQQIEYSKGKKKKKSKILPAAAKTAAILTKKFLEARRKMLEDMKSED